MLWMCIFNSKLMILTVMITTIELSRSACDIKVEKVLGRQTSLIDVNHFSAPEEQRVYSRINQIGVLAPAELPSGVESNGERYGYRIAVSVSSFIPLEPLISTKKPFIELFLRAS